MWPALAVGARILVVSNLTIDFAIGKEGQKGLYLNFAEVF